MKAGQFQLLLIYESSLVIPRNVRPPLLDPLASPFGGTWGILWHCAEYGHRNYVSQHPNLWTVPKWLR